jgi:hypothetical protein
MVTAETRCWPPSSWLPIRPRPAAGASHVLPSRSGYLSDDQGTRVGLKPGVRFVVMGDQNANPFDGDSVARAAQQLLENPRVNTSLTPTSLGGAEQAARQGGADQTHRGHPAFDTADFVDVPGPGKRRPTLYRRARTSVCWTPRCSGRRRAIRCSGWSARSRSRPPTTAWSGSTCAHIDTPDRPGPTAPAARLSAESERYGERAHGAEVRPGATRATGTPPSSPRRAAETLTVHHLTREATPPPCTSSTARCLCARRRRQWSHRVPRRRRSGRVSALPRPLAPQHPITASLST